MHMNRDILEDMAYQAGADARHSRELPEQVIVKPTFIPLRPDDEDDDREMIDGYKISAGGYIFEQTRADHIYYSDMGKVRAWLSENGYKHLRDLKNGYMAEPGFTGIYQRTK